MRRTGKAVGTLAAATSLALLGGGLAFADNINDDVHATSPLSIVAGQAGSAKVKIVANGGDGCDLTHGESLVLSFTGPEGVSVPNLTFTTCDEKTITISTTASAVSGTITAAIQSGATTGSYNNNVSIPVTITQPTTSATPTCAAIPAAPSVVAPTASATTGWSNLTTHPRTAPDVLPTFTLNPATGVQYKNGTGSWTDYDSAVELADGEHSILTRSVVAANGGCATQGTQSATPTVIKVDRTGPTGVAVNGITAGAEFFPHELPAGTCASTLSDSTSGLASGATTVPTQTRDGSALTYACSASDNAGNVSRATKAVVVKDYGFTKLLQPVDQGDVFNRVKAGSSIPVKFVLSSGASSTAILDGAPVAKQIACPSAMTADLVEELDAASVSGLVYEAGQHKYTWKTASAQATKCYELTVLLKGGEKQTAKFHFTK